ncbi:Soluble inorganic pyrophosphatase 1, chloroplastic [Hordeum vulgare]|nr:Soluble inorganic pyrophosphatase 1, chloroplastic [Hordeum vulgare]
MDPSFEPNHIDRLEYWWEISRKWISKARLRGFDSLILLEGSRFQQPGLTTTALLRPTELKPKDQGQPETLDYRVFLIDSGGRKVSPWHDVPLRAGDGAFYFIVEISFHFIVEIPKESSAKMEVATDEAYTPLSFSRYACLLASCVDRSAHATQRI